jgi:UDP-N-acetylmuramate dehydrogenase
MPTVRMNQPLAAQCRFNIGGPADYFVTVSDVDELCVALGFANERKLPVFVYSGGSNLFFDDAGFRGLVVRVRGGSWKLDRRIVVDPIAYEGQDSLAPNQPTDDLIDGPEATPSLAPPSIPDSFDQPVVNVSGGYELSRLVRELARLDMGGLDFLGNIPGSVAGAIAGNAGCYGRAVAEVLVETTLCNATTGEVRTVKPAELEFAYRHSRLKDSSNEVILDSVLRLVPRPRPETLAAVEAELAERLRKHPHNAACAGSFFQNPSRERPAWKLITDAGLSGTAVGGAQISPQHTNFLINVGDATSAQVRELAKLVRNVVKGDSGYELAAEVRYVSPEGLAETIPA